jgi:hypothetical protein
MILIPSYIRSATPHFQIQLFSSFFIVVYLTHYLKMLYEYFAHSQAFSF